MLISPDNILPHHAHSEMAAPPVAVSTDALTASHAVQTALASRSTVYCRLRIFEIRDAEEGGFYARALGHNIFTEGKTWNDLRANVLEAVALHFEDATARPRLVQMHYVEDELIRS
jgi:hypothetical protein